MKCWASNYCTKVNTEHCNTFCDVHVLMSAVYKQSNMPKKYQYEKSIVMDSTHVDYKKYSELNNFKNNVASHVENGEGLYIWSETTGNGKTMWATKIQNHYVRKTIFSGMIENVICYINVPTFLEELREQYREPSKEFQELRERVLKSKLVVFDDIGTEKPTEWVKERLYEIINYRDNEELATIYTSNVPLHELQTTLGTRIWSRIKGNVEVVELKGSDSR